jgi:hypothetical protein
VSQFGGFGGGASSLFGAGGAGVVSDDPYANIALDLNKVKKQEPPPKLYEHKTEEEKKSKTAAAASSAATKSNLKKDSTIDDKPKATSSVSAGASEKKGVTFGKSTTYEVEAGNQEDESGEYHTKDIDKEGGKGSPRPGGVTDKKVIAEKDLSDGRSEKEKILEMLEKQQREQLEEIKEMNQWKSKNESSKKVNYDDSVGDSSSSNPPLAISKKPEAAASSGSYESDDFEDVSASGSGSRSKLNVWPPKKTEEKYDVNAMEEYLKK